MLFDNLPLTSASRFSFFSGFLKLTVPLGKDRLVSAFKLVLGSNIAYSAMKTPGIIMSYKPFHNPPGIFKGQGAEGTDTLFFQALMPALDLPIALRVVGGSPHMAHAADADELLEIPRYELRTIV